MSVKKNKNITQRQHYSPEKEREIKALISIFAHFSFQVRREELKRGLGWRVQSGVCKIEEGSFIFVERRSSQEDQIAFLIRNAQELIADVIPEELLAPLPEELQNALRVAPSLKAA